MTRAIVCGEALRRAATTLGLELVAEGPDVVLLDAADPAALAEAGAIDPAVPRIVLADPAPVLLRAVGRGTFRLAGDASAAAIGPLIADLAPVPARRRTRTIVVTGVAGGCGRTLLAVELGLRLARRGVLLIDLTGTGAAAWRLGVEIGPWSDLEGLISELAPEHLGVLAADRDGVRVLGGAGPMPSPALALAVVKVAAAAADLVIVDAPVPSDERTSVVLGIADRILHVVPGEAGRVTPRTVPPEGAWVIASRDTGGRAGEVFRSLPDDPSSVRASRPGIPIGGALGRAIDDLAEVLAIDSAA